jgi:hypothetical protein
MTILAWCLIGAGFCLLLYGFKILSISKRSNTDIPIEDKDRDHAIKQANRPSLTEGTPFKTEKEREDAIQQIFAKYGAKRAALYQEAIRQGLPPDVLPPLDEWPFKK